MPYEYTIRRKAIWKKYVLRHDNMLRHAIKGRMEGKKTRGRKRMMLSDMIKRKRAIITNT